MWTDLTHLSVSPADLVIRGTIVFIFILILLRVSGKRQMGQMSATEFVALLLISNAVQNAMNGGDNSLVGGLLLATVLIFLSWFIGYLTFRHRKMRLLIEGTPTLLVHKGKVLEKNLESEHLSLSELKMLLRKQGIHHFNEITSAILESDGILTVTKVTDPA